MCWLYHRHCCQGWQDCEQSYLPPPPPSPLPPPVTTT
jgi:hypothetical protein